MQWSLTSFFVILMSDNWTKWRVWHLWADSKRNNIQILQDNWSKSVSVELSKYFRTVSTDQVVVYLGKAGCSRKTPFINLVTSFYLLISILLLILRNVLIAERAVPRDLYCKPLVYSSDRNLIHDWSRVEGEFVHRMKNHLPLYCLFVDIRQDLRMRSRAAGKPFLLSAFMI